MAQEKLTSSQQPQAANTASAPAAKVEEKKPEVSKTAETAEKKPAAKKTVKKKAAAKKKPAAKKTVSKKAAPKKKVAAKKPASKKTTAKKSTAKKTTAAKPSASKARNTGNTNTNINPTMEKIMAQGKVNFEKLTQDASDMGRENVEAMIKSTTIFAKGFEDLMRTAMSFAQNSAEKQSKYVKEVMGSKTLHEFTEVQNKIAQANFDDFMSNTTKLTELGVKTLNESIEPLNSQITKGMQKASKMAA